jgi:hypothetical protein
MALKITPKELPRELVGRSRLTQEATRRGIIEAAQWAKALLASRTPVDRGQMKAAWKVRISPGFREPAVIRNDAPYAGVVEMGARPHPVSKAGQLAILGWVRRNIPGLKPDEAEDVMQAIVWKIRERGQEGTYFVKRSMSEIAEMLDRTVEVHLNKAARRRAAGAKKVRK